MASFIGPYSLGGRYSLLGKLNPCLELGEKYSREGGRYNSPSTFGETNSLSGGK